jgi:Zn-dependent protease with chaperone function
MILVLAGSVLLATALLAPHALRQSALPPAVGVRLWTTVLVLRASVACAIALVAVHYLPATELFGLLTRWCFHAVLPFFAQHLGFDGHNLGDAAVLVPTIVIAALGVSGCFGLLRAARSASRMLARNAVGLGPRKSTVVAGPEILVAAAGVRRPRVVVSAGALLELDEQELAAGLEHEWGHVEHHHALISAGGHLCLAVSRILPGGRKAYLALRFHLERQADQYAIERTGDPLALAAAIAKAAPARGATPAMGLLGGDTSGIERVRLLMGRGGRHSRSAARAGRILAGTAALLGALVVLSLPVMVASAPAGGAWHGGHACQDEH